MALAADPHFTAELRSKGASRFAVLTGPSFAFFSIAAEDPASAALSLTFTVHAKSATVRWTAGADWEGVVLPLLRRAEARVRDEESGIGRSARLPKQLAPNRPDSAQSASPRFAPIRPYLEQLELCPYLTHLTQPVSTGSTVST
jgi:hypothetical protein